MCKTIFTGYYALTNRYRSDGLVPVQISGTSPIKIPSYHKLSPPKPLVYDYKNGIIDDIQYTKIYNEVRLKKLDPDIVYKDLLEITDGRIPILMCYEKPVNFCHRQIVADWFLEAGIHCLESNNKINNK